MIVLPVLYPRELLTAMDVHAVELWGPPGPPRGPGSGRLQGYVCALARNALAFLASGGGRDADAVLFPHTCDSIQGLATLAPDFGGWGKPAFRYLHPKGEDRPSARRFVRSELEGLSDSLARLTGKPLEPSRLSAAISLHAAIDRLRAELLSRRAFLEMSDAALYRLLRRGEYLWPEEHLEELASAARGIRGERVQRGVPLMVTGYLPEPMSIFDRLESAGAYVAADDYAAVGRRIPLCPPGDGGDPFDCLSAMPFRMPPCPTRTSDLRGRMDYLASLRRRSGAAGIVLHVPKFCEPENFDVPAILRTFAAIGVPALLLESELESDLSAQAATRLEAFVELLKDRTITH
ncbi:MAG: 2-hydroxyacyl-CoA dehydratase [Deltaproteobacteria bacterium]|nr:2-hydroxyacyl-CoA dehydratase [Deltaproteobacteria bacterium]